MIKKIKNFLFSSTSKDSLTLLIGNVITLSLNTILLIILTRNLSISDFGLIITGLSFIQLMSDGFEFGINSAILNFVPAASSWEKGVFLKSSFILKLLISLVLFFAILLFAKPISILIFNNPKILPIIQISSLSVFLMILFFWGISFLQAERRFKFAATVNSSLNFFRLILILILLLLNVFNLISVYLSLTLALALSVLLILFKLKVSLLLFKTPYTKYIQIIKFGLPIGIGFGLAAIYTRLDQIFILNLTGEREAGIYGLAQRLTLFFILAATSFGGAFVPRFTSIEGNRFLSYFKKTLLASLALAIITLGFIPISQIFIPLIFGSRFENSIAPFQILTVGIAFFILFMPFYSAIIYRFKKPFFATVISLVSVLVIFLLLNIVVPLYKSIGAAIVMSSVYGLQLLAAIIYFFINYKKMLFK